MLFRSQGLGIAMGVESMSSPTGAPVVYAPGWAFRLVTVLTLTAGTVFVMWLGEKITERGIGNGISLIICAGIVAGLPSGIGKSYRLFAAGDVSLFIILFIVILMAAVLVDIIYIRLLRPRCSPCPSSLTSPSTTRRQIGRASCRERV